MKSKTLVATVSLAVAALAWIAAPAAGTRYAPLPLSRSPLLFDADSAHRATGEFVTRYPDRVLGSLQSRQSTGFLRDRLASFGYQPDYMHFEARIARHKEVGRNVLVFRQGLSPEILAVFAHFDTARTTLQGASADGSGVGVLLELARVFAAEPTRRSLLFVLTDGEEWGMLGARELAGRYPERGRIVAALSLDHVSPGALAAFCLGETGQPRGWTPPWLRQIALQAALSEGLPVVEPGLIREHFLRAAGISGADQGPLLDSGIAAVNLGTLSSDRARERAIYHSSEDTIENLRVESVARYGRAAERIIRSIDELPSIPAQPAESLRLWDSLYLSRAFVTALQLASFLPLPVMLLWSFRESRREISLLRAGRELVAAAATCVPLAVIYFMAGLFQALRLIPTYSLYPATPKDPVLEHAPGAVMWGIFGMAAFAAVVCWLIVHFSFRSLQKPDFGASRTVLLCLLLVAVALAFRHNPYGAASFLLAPAWLWSIVGRGRTATAKMGSRILIAAGGIPYAAAWWSFARSLEMGWNSVWYQIIALGTGLFSAPAFFLWAASVALGIRFLVLGRD